MTYYEARVDCTWWFWVKNGSKARFALASVQFECALPFLPKVGMTLGVDNPLVREVTITSVAWVMNGSYFRIRASHTLSNDYDPDDWTPEVIDKMADNIGKWLTEDSGLKGVRVVHTRSARKEASNQGDKS